MSILRALQKKQTEEIHGPGIIPAENVVPFDKSGRIANAPPELFSENLKIGTPVSAFNGQSASMIGTALPDLERTILPGQL